MLAEKKIQPQPESVAVSAVPVPEPSNLAFLWKSPLFWSVTGIKLLLGSLFASHYLTELFIPFLNKYVESGFSNPWVAFHTKATINMFPYPPVMLYLLGFFRLLFSPFLEAGTYSVTWLHLLAMRLPLLGADFLAFVVLLKWFPTRSKLVLLLYWCSPIAIYVSYWHGQLDVVPTALFLACLYLFREKRFSWGMVVYGLAVASKSHLMTALPFLGLYLLYERGWRRMLQDCFAGLATYAFLVGPYLFEPAFRKMVYGTSEQMRLFALQIPYGDAGTGILVAPLAILTLWFRFAAYPKRNWDLFMLYLGLIFCVFVLLTPPAPGYFMWSLPFIVFFMCRIPRNRLNHLVYWGFVGSYFLYYILGANHFLLEGLEPVFPSLAQGPSLNGWIRTWSPATADLASSLSFTLLQGALAGTILSMYFFGVRSNAVYRLRTSPVLVGLAGDSGAGKDYFVALLRGLLGEERTAVTSGDDYHKWPRGDLRWRQFTHLDPKANNLYEAQRHVASLSEGEGVVHQAYNHDTGLFDKRNQVDSNKYVIFSGLHSLSLESMRRMLDLKVFLDPDERLRLYWKSKRDMEERGYSAGQVKKAIDIRAKDREKFILPQRSHADIVVRFLPVAEGDITPDSELRLEIQALNGFNFVGIAGILSGLGMEIEHDPYLDPEWQLLRLRGAIESATLERICLEAIPNVNEIAEKREFRPGLSGCLQLIVLSALSDQLRFTHSRGA